MSRQTRSYHESLSVSPNYRRLKRLYCNYDLDVPSIYRHPTNLKWLKSYEYDYYFFQPNTVRNLVGHFEEHHILPSRRHAAAIQQSAKQSSDDSSDTKLPAAKPVGLPVTKAVRAPLTLKPKRSVSVGASSRITKASASSSSTSATLSRVPISTTALTSAKAKLKKAQSTHDLSKVTVRSDGNTLTRKESVIRNESGVVTRKEVVTPKSITTHEVEYLKGRHGRPDCVREMVKHFEADWFKI